VAEREGFEPSVGFPTPAFQASAIDHSATSPGCPSGRPCGGRLVGERGGKRFQAALVNGKSATFSVMRNFFGKCHLHGLGATITLEGILFSTNCE
jgi:hypothetical protein